MDIEAAGWLPHRDRSEYLGEGICSRRACVMRFGVKVGEYLYMGGLKRQGWIDNKDAREQERPRVPTRPVRL